MWADVLASVEEAWLVFSRSEELDATFLKKESLEDAFARGAMEGRLVFMSNGPEGSFPVYRVIRQGDNFAWLAIILPDAEYESFWRWYCPEVAA